MKTPRLVDIAITGKCNLSCKICYYADEMVALNDLPTSQWLDFIDELGKLNVIQVLLTGGEPMSHPDILTFIDAVVKNRMCFNIYSNGMLFNNENARYIKDTGRCNLIFVSIDGSCPEVHDKIRGEGSFVKTVRGIQILHDVGLPVNVRVTINRINHKDLPNIIKFLCEDLNVKNVCTNETFPRGSYQGNIDDIYLTREERLAVAQTCLEFAEKYPSLTNAYEGPMSLLRKFKQINEDQWTPAEGAHTGGTLSTCKCSFNSLAVLHDGKIVPCHQLPHIVLGQVGVDSVKKVWDEAVGLHYLRTRHRIPLGQLEECRDCKYQQYCSGGCPGAAYAMTGKMTVRNPRDCYRVLLGEEEKDIKRLT
jgi:SynChlorMet cassette radical SAM/SPASM protein ScmE